MTDKALHKRLLDVCYKKQLHHLGSYFSSLDLIDDIYSKMNFDEDIFILSAGHSVVASVSYTHLTLPTNREV